MSAEGKYLYRWWVDVLYRIPGWAHFSFWLRFKRVSDEEFAKFMEK